VSIEAIRGAMAEVRDQIVAAHQDVSIARERLADAVRTLTELSRNHSASLLPPEHQRADEQLATCLEALAGSLACVDRYAGGL
jgi:predicted  nucleic acid-binding Zn-ribbon protein